MLVTSRGGLETSSGKSRCLSSVRVDPESVAAALPRRHDSGSAMGITAMLGEVCTDLGRDLRSGGHGAPGDGARLGRVLRRRRVPSAPRAHALAGLGFRIRHPQCSTTAGVVVSDTLTIARADGVFTRSAVIARTTTVRLSRPLVPIGDGGPQRGRVDGSVTHPRAGRGARRQGQAIGGGVGRWYRALRRQAVVGRVSAE